VLVGAGDIANCSLSGDEATAKLLDNISGTVFTLGDNAYPNGSSSDYTNCYGPTWGRVKARTMATPGNHEYQTTNAAGYFGYFGSAAGDPTKGYYSYNLGDWHIVVLNSNSDCVAIGCSATSAQMQWLRSDLISNPKACTLAYWHHPRFNSGASHGNDLKVAAFWDTLYKYNADVVLNGHEHVYERFAPQTPNAVADPQRGIRQFTVGTGGASVYMFKATPEPNSEVRNATSLGVLKLTLRASGYDWQFVPVAGATFTDAGSGTCH
jgi:acid phosphatase type 7